MSSVIPAMRHVRGFDVARPLSIGVLVLMMLPLVFLPLASIFIFGTSNGLDKFWAALTAPEAIFALKLSMATSFWATVFNVFFGLFAAYVLSRYNFWGRGCRVAVALGTVRHARTFVDAARLSNHVYGRRDHSREYLRHVPARFRRHQARVRHDEPLARRSVCDDRRDPPAHVLARHPAVGARRGRL